MIPHTINYSWNNGSRSSSAKVEIDATGEVNEDITVGIGGTNVETDFTLSHTNIQSLYILSNVDVTIKTNSSGSPADTLNIKGNIPFIWQAGGYASAPFSADITKIFVTNASGQQARITWRSLTN